MKNMKRIAVTGGGGQIAYSLLFRLAAGELFGPDQSIALHIRDLKEMRPALEGLAMELEDCAFPLLKEIKIGHDPYEIFDQVDVAFLVGAKPRGPGMERKELLFENAKIFVDEGKALNKVASRSVKVLVVGNPCNTNALIALKNAPDLNPKNFHAMMRLDQNRARALLAKKAGVSVTSVSEMIIWGNHSSTQVPDILHAKISGKKACEVITDISWLQEEFITSVQKRGAAIIAARGKSSAASAANAALDAMCALIGPSQGELFTTAMLSQGNPYGISEDLVFGFPCQINQKGELSIVQGLSWDEKLRERIKQTEKELIEERELIREFI